MELAWVDLLLLLVLLASLLLGVWRGLVFEVLSLLGWVVAYFACPYLSPLLENLLPRDRMGPSLAHMAGLLMAFMLILVVWGLGARLVRALIQATPLSVIDRVLGAGFGAVRGVLVCLLLVLVVSMTPAATSNTWQASRMAPCLESLLHTMRPVLPEDMVKLIPA
jgi:membrane protein required for colicin V production